ncbi:MAG: F0F1 ATP synthase subunit gamma [Oscillospiraceae bacterium]|nr:F0F1 ATP synthase subunit gamma [Oscillospiraceae bacterium]
MAGLQELRKRLRSIRSTGQLASAMRTAATAKYARLNRVRGDFSPYAQACEDMLHHLGGSGIRRETEEIRHRDAVVLMSSNRGLCGGFNAELFRFFSQREVRGEEPPLLFVCGRKAAGWLREQGLEAEEYLLSDIPSYSEAKALSDRLRQLYVAGEAERILVVYQSFHNMLTQVPAERQLLPEPKLGEGKPDADLLYLPDRETIGEQLAVSCLDTAVYHLALENAAGAQAATLVAMRSACDNADASAAKLEITINRRRQAEVTASVIETAAGNLQQGV